MSKPVIHGNDHRPGHPDPIPDLVVSSDHSVGIDTTNGSYDLQVGPQGGSPFPVASTGAPTFPLQDTIRNDSSYNAFPSIAVNAFGKLIVTYRQATTHLSVDGKIAMQSSTDAGATWSSQSFIASPAAGHDFRGPFICCTTTGRLIVNFYDLHSSTFDLYTMYSDDHGTTWTTPVSLAALSGVTGTGAMIQHSSGPIIQAVYGENTGDTAQRCAVLRSTDNGATWSAPQYIGPANTDYTEVGMIELPDRSILAFIRHDSGGATVLYTASSTDLGVTWTTPTSMGFSVWPGQPAPVIFPASQAIILFYRNTASPFKAVYRWSFDLGVTWSAETIYSNSQYEYASGCVLTPHLIGYALALENSSTDADVLFLTMAVETGIPVLAPAAVAKGDMIAASGPNAWGVKTVGSNNSVLVADSAQTLGVKWVQVGEAMIALADVTTDNVTSSAHGFAPKSPADATKFLNGATTPAYAQVKDSDLATTDITTNNVSTSKHGFAPKSDGNSAHYLDGTGAYSTPAGGGGGVSSPLTTKGDVWGYSSVDARIPIGSDGNVLTADSSQTLGLKWGTAGAGTFVAKRYLNKPAANITRASTSIGAFSTAWQITGVVVASGQNVNLRVSAAAKGTTANADFLLVLLRNSTQIAAVIFSSADASNISARQIEWIDENPGAATYTYEVQAAQFGSGTLTVYQTDITTDTNGGTSIFIAEVYTP